ncbi:hypothetical protein GGD66_008086 [Bradyrhizobium sp. CIR48]|uniref:DUF6036 family nucleotidyltransferase n=1 Tax=unclassified Bradyrhizobium TaxID=2631580 RepID=UPI0008DFCA90|nr:MULTISPECIES: DUF6036 family nucleotidyltransferase [unclassified Bradyrhizobium]MBB4381872.1 hypothetical protein [Bradyrhizobium sp. SBR1B]MBB4429484.1 hypothetical protein [Bradyrhizobium sp. CIR48]SFM70191.1 hypothetical protein SAMN05216573_103574 [Bradyrhizobium sp. Rc3b]
MVFSDLKATFTEHMVSTSTAWMRRRPSFREAGGTAVTVQTEVEGRTVIGVAPAPEDLVVSKIARLDERDKQFVGAIHETHPLDLELIERRIRETDLDPAIAERAVAYIRSLKSKS